MSNRFSSPLERVLETLYISSQPVTDRTFPPRFYTLAAKEKKDTDSKELAKEVNGFCLKLIDSYHPVFVSGLRTKTVVIATFYMVQVARGVHYPVHDCEELTEAALGETVDRYGMSIFYKNAVKYNSVKKTLIKINKSCGSPGIPPDASPCVRKVFIEA